MSLLFNQGKKYIACHACCIDCKHHTIVFIEDNYSLMNIMEVDKVCSKCGLHSDTVTDGDLIMRYDWPNADDEPWQLQSAFIDESDYLCTDCYEEVQNTYEDWKRLRVACSQCNGVMLVRQD